MLKYTGLLIRRSLVRAQVGEPIKTSDSKTSEFHHLNEVWRKFAKFRQCFPPLVPLAHVSCVRSARPFVSRPTHLSSSDRSDLAPFFHMPTVAHVWRKSCARKLSIPARLSAPRQPLLLQPETAFPFSGNTHCQCFPNRSFNTSIELELRGTARLFPAFACHHAPSQWRAPDRCLTIPEA